VIDLERGTARYAYGTGQRGYGGDGGDARAATFNLPSTIQFDELGNLYIFDQWNYIVRKVDTDGVVTAFAGKVETRQVDHDGDPATPPNEVTRGWVGYAGDGHPALEARFYASFGAVADPSNRMKLHDGSLFVVDTENHLVRRIDLAAGTIEHVAGFVQVGQHPNYYWLADEVNLGRGFEDGPVDTARFSGPRDIDIAADGTMYIADTENHCVRRIRDGMVDTVAGVCGEVGSDEEGAAATSSRLWRPYGVALSPDGTRLMIADTQNQVFRMVGL
jgi:DNA-binding beta-propeller fold protein YncE